MSRLRLAGLIVVAVLATVALCDPAASSAPAAGGRFKAPFVPGEVLVAFRPEAPGQERAAARAQIGAARLHQFRSGAERWKLAPGASVEETVAALERDPRVRYAEPNYIVSLDVVPDDPLFAQQWALVNTGQTGGKPDADIDADQAWSVSTGRSGVVVAVIDTGVDYRHPDLAANIWTNPGEIPGNGIDDDGNGYVDDVHGYDFINHDNDPMDDNFHGTHVAGTIGALGDNGIGVAGVCWRVSIMPLKFLGSEGSGNTADAAEAVDYATRMGADLTSNSWGGGGFSQTLYDAIAAAGEHEIAFVAAAGNNNNDNDRNPFYPATYDLPNIISVAATDAQDARASFSNYGATTVDLGAPGVRILSTLPNNSYGLLSGTSMATPHVAGACALIRALSPGVPVALMKSILLKATDPLPDLAGRTVSGGRLNVFRAIATPDTVPPDPVTNLAVAEPSSNTMRLTWTATGDDGSVGTANSYDLRYSTAPIDAGNFDTASHVGHTPNPAPSGAPESMEVPGLSASTTYYFALKTFDEWGNASALSNLALGTTLPPPTADAAPMELHQSLFTGEQAGQQVILTNAGKGTLDYTIPTPVIQPPAPTLAPSLLPAADAAAPQATLYRFSDSDHPGGPRFDWIEISETGRRVEEIVGDDEESDIYPMSFDFPFYGGHYDRFLISTNGWLWLAFDFQGVADGADDRPLPAIQAPPNMVGPFWDDLDFDGAPHAFFQDFGDHLVIEWSHVDRYGGGSDLTFEAILHDDGTITLQYLHLQGVTDSATVGIQDTTRTQGLTVVSDQPYLHDGLAIEIAPVRQWLTISPSSGRLAAGQSIPLSVAFDATGLDQGVYPGTVSIATNDPLRPSIPIPVTMEVSGAPVAVVDPGSIAFGDVVVGLPAESTVRLRNDGSAVLHVSGIVSSAPGELAVSPVTMDVAPHSRTDLTVTWTPPALADFSGGLTVESNDLDTPALFVPVTGHGVSPPAVVPQPASFSETLFTGRSVTRTLSIGNAGGVDLTVDASAVLTGGASGAAPASVPGPAGFGGPDRFGYRWRDSDEPGGPVFDWVDIGATGTPVAFSSLDDGVSAPIDLPMAFPFYGANVSRIWISTNGWLAFTAPAGSDFANGPLPSTSGPQNLVAIFWDDLHARDGSVRTLYDGRRFIIQFTRFGRVVPASGVDLTFQVILYPTGRIVLQYLTMTGAPLDSATIGIQNNTRTIGLQVVRNAAYVHDGLAIEINRVPDWLSVRPAHAVIPPGGTAPFDVTFDATGRDPGRLDGAIALKTNAAAQPEVSLPATLEVLGAPEASVSPATQDFGTVYAGYTRVANLQVTNNGSADLKIGDVSTTDPELVVQPSASGAHLSAAGFSLAPGETLLLDMLWTPAAPHRIEAEIRVSSNDPVQAIQAVTVTGNAVAAPVAAASPSSVDVDLAVGDVAHRIIHLQNEGGSDLEFEATPRAVAAAGAAAFAGAPVTVSRTWRPEAGGPGAGPGILGAGGPDLYGYTWEDSDEPGGPAFDWVDISGVGSRIVFPGGEPCDDCVSAAIPIGFGFPYFGHRFESIRATTNGTLSFTSTLAPGANQPLPTIDPDVPENLLAVLWDDLVERDGSGPEPRTSAAYSYGDGTRFIVQYEHYYRVGSYNDDLEFEIVLEASGRIIYQYRTLSGLDPAVVVGLQNATRDDGLTVALSSSYLHPGLAVALRSPDDYLQVNPASGTLPPGGAVDLDLSIDGGRLIGGRYAAVLSLVTNDPARAVTGIPVSVHATGVPRLGDLPAGLNFPTTFVGFAASLPLTVRNVGTDVLTIGGHTVEGDFALSGATEPVALAVGESVDLTVTFAPVAGGPRAGLLTIQSDDPARPAATVTLAGTAIVPPALALHPAAIATALPPASTRTKTVSISNPGGSPLQWSIGAMPSWVGASPAQGTLDAGAGGTIDLVLKSDGLADGPHAGSVAIDTNDPRAPETDLPVSLDVGLVAAVYLAMTPRTINAASHGQSVRVSVELPPGLDPRAVDPCSVRLLGTVAVPGCPAAPRPGTVFFTDEWPAGGDGIEEMVLVFDRQALVTALGGRNPQSIPIEGEVTDVQWWSGLIAVRTTAPPQTVPRSLRLERHH